MEHITVAEHLESMTEVAPPPWMVELGEMLREIEELDSALAASMAYDLARDPENAQALHQLIQGYQSMSKIVASKSLTSMQEHTIRKTIQNIGMKLLALSDPNNSFQTNALYEIEKEK
jgi:hypothetical protein